ncbi:polysaccharide biosynthesis/export family protein [Marinilongibacter aquaticus]|uniref:polysaccharide biosynthesis/export family protein n=1 Tax=Marinilongibacter aquaticus TaxID=2975157 RepID=UPI0021BD4E97|nr:polysaccharide biosynthesis/export family protein [Marinilongibacter aquaticus]UBM58069.1 polysaccharide biosynthesis/export family protein [Marinilongibacter aquaticus]
MNQCKWGLLILAATVFTSCVNTKKFVYFQDEGQMQNPAYVKTVNPHVSKIKTDDILAITVSSLNEESNSILNFQNINILQMSTFPGQSGGSMGSRQPLGYRVDSTGSVVIPFIGKQHLGGLSLRDAGEKITAEMGKYFKDPAVNIRYLNHKFSVLGEVKKVGTYNLLDDQTTLPEALAMAGDLTIYGKRDSVMVIREANGVREIGKVNLLNREVFSSEYYYVRNGDVIYIEPIKGRVTSTEQRVQLVPIFTGIATTVAVLLNLFLK